MTTTEKDLTTDNAPVELERIAELRWKDGNDIVIAVKDAGRGPAIDVREYVTRDAYTDSDFDVVSGGRKGRRQRAPYMGPTRRGFWLSLEMAESLTDAIAAALVVAGSLKEGGA
jgi:hypothetical protein